MSALWAEPFDEYPDAAHMLNGTWAQIDGLWLPSTANPRTGTTAFRFDGFGHSGVARARRVFGAPKLGAGVEYALFVPALPNGELFDGSSLGLMILGVFLDASAQGQIVFALGTDGSIIAYSGMNYPDTIGYGIGPQIGRSDPAVVTNAYCQIGLKVGHVDATAGTCEARVNGVTVLNLAGINSNPSGAGEVSQIAFSAATIYQPFNFDIDDLHAWDINAGNGPNDFVGNAAVIYRPPVQDTVEADWTLFGGGPPAYPLLSDNNDATGISAASPGERSAFLFEDLPVDVAAVVYQQISWRGLKTDAGACNVTPGFISDGLEDDGPAQAMTTGETWRWWVSAYDPSTSGAPWTPASANAAEGVFDRSA